MPQIVQQGALNTTALVVPDLYVQIVPPQNMLINGVPTNVVGVVGTAQWGPKNQPMLIGSMSQYAQTFGAIQNRTYDMGTVVAAAVLQGAQNFRCVRATDGTDAAAAAVVQTSCITFTGLYTGTLGNSITATIGAGSRLGSSKVSVGIPGFLAETFDNIGAGPAVTTTGATAATTIPVSSTVGLSTGMIMYGTGVSGSPTISSIGVGSVVVSSAQTVAAGATLTFALGANALWVAMQNAINSGNAVGRGPSNVIVATAGAGTAVPTLASYTLVGGTDGVATLTAQVIMNGANGDTTPRTGMYALRGQGCSVAVVCTADDSASNNAATWTTQAAFGLSEGVYMVCAGTQTETIATAVTNKSFAGADTYALKIMLGDWIYWNDPVNQTLRLISPQGFVAGRLGNLSPEQSPLNKPLYGIVGTQKSGLVPAQNTTYAVAELQTLAVAGIDVICNPQPGGAYYGTRMGHNASSNFSIHGDNYTRMTNYIASTLAAGMGQYVGQVINSTLFAKVRSTLLNFFYNMLYAGQLGSTDGSLPFSVVCDITNNPQSLTGLGYLTANVQVQFQAINEFFIVNLEGGQTVTVLKQSTTVSNVPATPVA